MKKNIEHALQSELDLLKLQAETWPAEEVLRWALAKFGQNIAIASGFGVEGMALIDLASRLTPHLRIMTLDTEFLFPETYELIERTEKRYGIRVERIYSALRPEEQAQSHGPALWARDPDQCCNLRKVEPLRRKLSQLQAWGTAIRREQSSARAHAHKIEWDRKFHLVKINPIVDWTAKQVWTYIFEHDVPYNPLHDQNYPSIGCIHCTRSIRPGEDARAGRWSGFQKTECGLHADPASAGGLVRLEIPAACEE